MFRCHRLLVATVALSPLSLPAFAADEVAATVPQIVISATRSPLPLNRVASSMTVITAEEIKRKNKPTVVELLREVPGITVANNGGAGQTSRVFMRGTNSNHVLVLVDGMAVNDPSDPGDAFDFSNLTTDNVERIEVLRGAQSTLYGSQAIGGVISVITRKGSGTPSNTAFAEYGSRSSARIGAGNSGEIGRTSYSIHASTSATEGISSYDKSLGGTEKDGSRTYTLAANMAGKLTDAFTAKFAMRYNRTNTEFDSPGGFMRPADDAYPENDSRQINARAAGEWSLFGGRWTQELGVATLHLNRAQITEYFDSIGNPFFGRQQYFGRRDTVDWIHRVRIAPFHQLTFGAEAWSDHYKTNTLREVNVDTMAVFADDQFNIGRNLFVNAGSRLDFHQAFGRQFTWKIAPGYAIRSTGTRLKTSYGTGFKAPSLTQLYDPSYGNVNLSPESSRGWDMGFEQSLWHGNITFGSTFFRNTIRQLIGNDSAPPFRTKNTGKARTQGVENVAAFYPAEGWAISATHVYTLSQDRTRDIDLVRRPRHQGTLGVKYDYSASGDVGLDVRYSGKRSDIDINYPYGRVNVKSFTTVGINTNYRISPAITMYGRIENLLDKRYQEVFAYGQPGVSVYTGVRADF